ncbi:hypothetical protein E2562_000533 [Oryza meyeriana var. granulata]|uniref:BLE2 protein n=1 Tax=Oryza meyeriana var. granulata TaxID=110450 RepID=A0A6G1DTD5_9ORYZ|nr:hypothetical protein E2562_000533 [Oryza meyeriana var. granulata]
MTMEAAAETMASNGERAFLKLLPRLKEPEAGAADEAAKREENNDDMPAKLMEDKLNWYRLRSAVCYKAASGFGTLAFIWATVVLLGGFATLVKQRDFWFVTIIAFIQAIGLFGGGGDHDFMERAPQALFAYDKIVEQCEGRIWRKHGSVVDIADFGSFACSWHMCFACLPSLAVVLVQLAALATLVALPSMRLSSQDYVDPEFRGHPDHSNVRRLLNIFYALVLAQGFSYLCQTINEGLYYGIWKQVVSKYKLGLSGKAVLDRYCDDNYNLCINGNVRDALNMDFLSYAMGLARSDSITDQLLGVRAIDDMLAEPRYRVLAPRRLLLSSETMNSLVRMLTFDGDGEIIRGPAASVLLCLAPSLLARSIQGLIHFTSSLLHERKDGDMEYAWFGLSIIDKLMDNPDNHRFAVEEADNLIAKVVRLATTNLDRRRHGDHRPNFPSEIVLLELSITVLDKLVAIGGEAGKVLKRDFAELLSNNNCTMIVEHGAPAIRIIACCALDGMAREQFGNTPEIIRALLKASCLLLSAPQQPDDQAAAAAATAAANALVLLTTDCNSNVIVVLGEIDDREMKQLVNNMLQRKSMAAKLLHNLRAYMGTDQYTDRPHLMEVIDNALPKVLQAIVGVNTLEERTQEEEKIQPASNTRGDQDRFNVNEEGKVFESFVGLAVQICVSKKLSDLPVEHGTHLTIRNLAEKLTKILETYHSPTTDIPGIRRVTIELMIWMMKSNKSNIGLFWSSHSRVPSLLESVALKAQKLENFSLFYNGAGVGKHCKPVSSVARAALALMYESPSFVTTDQYYGGPA